MTDSTNSSPILPQTFSRTSSGETHRGGSALTTCALLPAMKMASCSQRRQLIIDAKCRDGQVNSTSLSCIQAISIRSSRTSKISGGSSTIGTPLPLAGLLYAQTAGAVTQRRLLNVRQQNEDAARLMPVHQIANSSTRSSALFRRRSRIAAPTRPRGNAPIDRRPQGIRSFARMIGASSRYGRRSRQDGLVNRV